MSFFFSICFHGGFLYKIFQNCVSKPGKETTNLSLNFFASIIITGLTTTTSYWRVMPVEISNIGVPVLLLSSRSIPTINRPFTPLVFLPRIPNLSRVVMMPHCEFGTGLRTPKNVFWKDMDGMSRYDQHPRHCMVCFLFTVPHSKIIPGSHVLL